MTYSVWILPVNHKILSKKFNTNIPIYVPLAEKVPENLLPRYREILEPTTMIRNIGKGYSMMKNDNEEYKLCQRCSIFDDRPAHMVLYDLNQELDIEEIWNMFPELANPIEDDIPGILCFARRTLTYPFGYEMIFPFQDED